MNRNDLNQLVTIKDLEAFRNALIKDLREILQMDGPNKKKFYTPKEFSYLTGMAYSTVVNRCKVGKLKARQDEPKCSWQIDVSEIERYKSESYL